MSKIKTIILLVIAIGLVSCHQSQHYFPNDSRLEKSTIDIIRYDSAMLSFTADSTTIYDNIQQLYDFDNDFTTFFCEQIIGIPSTDTAAFANAMLGYLNDTVYGFNITNEREKKLFSNIDTIHKDISTAFSRIRYLYPDIKIPKITFFVSGFNASLLFWKDELYSNEADYIAIGTDMYLGHDYEYYNRVVYNYQKATMEKQCIPIDIVSAYMFKHFPFSSNKNRLLDNMIYRGKIMFVVSQIFDNYEPCDVMGYNREQWQWCKKNESRIWRTIMDKHDLFKTETLILTSYLNDGPFTAEISQDSPGRLGTWIGWQIVESYMSNNKNIDIKQLLEENDAQKILELSNYKP